MNGTWFSIRFLPRIVRLSPRITGCRFAVAAAKDFSVETTGLTEMLLEERV